MIFSTCNTDESGDMPWHTILLLCGMFCDGILNQLAIVLINLKLCIIRNINC